MCEGLGWLYFLAGRSRKGLVFIILYVFNRGLDVLEMTDPERNALLDDEKSPSDNSGCNEDNACSSFTQCRVYKRRWYILFVFTMTSIVSNMMWNTWGPIQRPCRLVFGWERWTVLLLSSLGAIGPILGAFPSTWLMDSRGEPLGLKILHIYYSAKVVDFILELCAPAVTCTLHCCLTFLSLPTSGKIANLNKSRVLMVYFMVDIGDIM